MTFLRCLPRLFLAACLWHAGLTGALAGEPAGVLASVPAGEPAGVLAGEPAGVLASVPAGVLADKPAGALMAELADEPAAEPADILAAEPARCMADGSQARHVVDMAGRAVTLPHEARRIATVGSVPVINGYLLALGVGERIVNGLPSRFAASGRWRLLAAVAPYLAGRPVLQGQGGGQVSIENLVRLDPDVVITMNLLELRALEKARVPAVYLEWADSSDIRASMRILGCLTGRESRGEAYLRYLDDTMERLREALDRLPPGDPPKVLYFNPHTMSTPLRIADWWIEQAGGRSATAGAAQGGNAQYSHERVLLWNPDVLIVNSPEQVAAVYQDPRFSGLGAVRDRRVYAVPMGVHSWGQRTVEQPLAVLWAATVFHGRHLARIDMKDEIRNFYRRFFDYALSDDEIRAVFEGGPG